MTRARALALAAILLLAGAVRAQAGDTQVALVPEVHAHLKLSDHARHWSEKAILDGSWMPPNVEKVT